MNHVSFFHIECIERHTSYIEAYQETFTEFFVEGVREELGETGENLNDIQIEAAVVAKLQQQWAHSCVHHLHVNLTPASDEL